MLLSLQINLRVAEKNVSNSVLDPWFIGPFQDVQDDVRLAFQEAMLFHGPVFLKTLMDDVPEAKAYVTFLAL